MAGPYPSYHARSQIRPPSQYDVFGRVDDWEGTTVPIHHIHALRLPTIVRLLGDIPPDEFPARQGRASRHELGSMLLTCDYSCNPTSGRHNCRGKALL